MGGTMQMQWIRSSILSLTGAALLATVISCEKSQPPVPASAPAEKAAVASPGPPVCNDCVLVTPDNFVRAETDMYFAVTLKQAGEIGKFHHDREPAPVDKQLPLVDGWNSVRLYRPRAEILSGKWKFPEAQPAS
jgi:hypothetical protein